MLYIRYMAAGVQTMLCNKVSILAISSRSKIHILYFFYLPPAPEGLTGVLTYNVDFTLFGPCHAFPIHPAL